ncbi:MAG TPA: nicotinamidase [Solirubrobacteraceae bacterium]|nr:nicotinamidase [Solirubrobacteraceae bacterium]
MARALIVVDVQNDFTPGGALAVREGDAIAPRIDALARSGDYDVVVATRDWHPPDHASFAAQGGPWPPHCVQGTSGAELHAGLDRALVDVVVDTGQEPDVEGYSGFEQTRLEQLLRERGVDEVTIVGLATDYCVQHTALAALRLGFGVTVDSTAVRPVEVQPGDGERALEEIREAGGSIA